MREPLSLLCAIAVSGAIVGCRSGHAAPAPPSPPSTDAGPPIRPSDDAGPPPLPPATTLPSVPQVDVLPAVAGGSLLATRSGLVVAGDPDRVSLWVIDAASGTLHGRLALGERDEPGRMVEDGSGLVHVVLRGANAIADVDPSEPRILALREVCAAPRGIDWEAATDMLHVACAGGELVSLPAAAGAATRTLFFDPDLRDVIAADGVLYVSRFRSAELLTIEDGTLVARRRPAPLMLLGREETSTESRVAWRLRRMPEGGVIMLHQRAVSSVIDVETTGYGGLGRCVTGVTAPALSIFPPSGPAIASGVIAQAALLVDVAVAADGATAHAALATTEVLSHPNELGPVLRVPLMASPDACVWPSGASVVRDAAVAVEHMADGTLVTLHRDPLQITIGSSFRLSGSALESDRGHDVFHATTPTVMACASCHPEGAEDGHTWDFAGIGPRRTQTLLGGLLGTEPFHWAGDVPDMSAIMEAALGVRMGARFVPTDIDAVATWLDRLPSAPGRIDDADAVARGRVLFEGDAACASCHAGASLTDNTSIDVGTGGAFQVPSLRGVMHRAPFFHDGCVATLSEVVAGGCGTLDRHGRTSHLGDDARNDLVAYLTSL